MSIRNSYEAIRSAVQEQSAVLALRVALMVGAMFANEFGAAARLDRAVAGGVARRFADDRRACRPMAASASCTHKRQRSRYPLSEVIADIARTRVPVENDPKRTLALQVQSIEMLKMG